MLEDFLNKLAASKGQSNTASLAKVDPSTLCKFLSHQGAMKLKDIENVLALGDAVIVDRGYIEMLRQTIRNLGVLINEN